MKNTHDTAGARFQALVEAGTPPVIMQIVPALNAGGVEQGVIDINAAIAAAGGVSIVVSSGGVRDWEITKAGGIHIQLPVHTKNPLTIAANISRLRKVIREHNVDIVHACSRAPAWSAERAVKDTPARYMTSCHAAHKVTNGLKRWYNASIARGERVIAVSHFLADYLENNYQTRPDLVRVVHRGVALDRFHPSLVTPQRLIDISRQWRIPEGASVIILPARLTRIKGHMFLLDAMEKLDRKDIFCLFLGSDVGNEKYRAELDAYIQEKNMGSMVRIVTECKDMPAAYMLSAAVVCPSIVPEGFGRVPVEAQAMGRPVIATDHGGARETVLRDETGILVPPEDVDSLADALKSVLAMDERARAVLATKAMAHVASHFTNVHMCGATLDVYAELVEPKQAQTPLISNDITTIKDQDNAPEHSGYQALSTG